MVALDFEGRLLGFGNRFQFEGCLVRTGFDGSDFDRRDLLLSGCFQFDSAHQKHSAALASFADWVSRQNDLADRRLAASDFVDQDSAGSGFGC